MEVLKEEMEYCIMCGKPTGVPRNMPIDLRNNYIEGMGQLCVKCAYESIVEDSNSNQKEFPTRYR